MRQSATGFSNQSRPKRVNEMPAAVALAAAGAPALSECSAAPVRVLVHDPARTGAFERLARTPAEQVQAKYLFRSLPEPGTFSRQHQALVALLRAAGIAVVQLGDILSGAARHALDAEPNYVYTRDAVITLPWLPGYFVRGAMRKPIRRAEPAIYARALRALGLLELFAVPEGRFLEGGDVIPFAIGDRRLLLVGFGPRTSRESIDLLADRLLPDVADEIIGIELARERMNLDGALVPVAEDTILAEPTSIVGSFVRDASGERKLDVLQHFRNSGLNLIAVTRPEATTMQACNCICLGGREVICYDLCSRVINELRDRNITAHTIPASELIKGTGGPRCMTRPLYA
jgi:N-dimethylarginine dimethylaminohydrolase